MSINNDRKEAMCLSNPYLKNNMTFVVKKDSNINSINDLKGKKLVFKPVQQQKKYYKVQRFLKIYHKL